MELSVFLGKGVLMSSGCRLLPLLFASSLLWAATKIDNTQLYEAIRNNDLNRLHKLIRDGADVNQRDSKGETPLMYAAVAGSPEAMKLLLASGADANARNEFGATALTWSVTDLAKVRLLVDHGADVNAATRRGRTPLLLAAMSDGSAPIVRLLLDKGADVKATDFLKTTALRAATLGNDTDTIRMMIDAGVDVNAADLPGITPLMMAAGWNGNLAAVQLLLAKGAKVNAVSRPVMGLPSKNGPSEFGNLTALLMCAPFGPPELIKALLDAGADVNARDVRGMTPLMLAVATGHQDRSIIRMLLEGGADPSTRSEAGDTAADWALRYGLRPALELLHVSPPREPANPRSAAAVPPVRAAVESSIRVIEKSSWQFFAGSGCVSCHAQSMTDMAVAEARRKGAAVDEKAAQQRAMMVKANYPPEPLLERMDPPGAEEQLAYPLAGFALSAYPPDRITDAMVANIAATQGQDGSFHVGAAARPPGEEGDIFRTAVCILAMKAYGPPGRAQEMRMRLSNAQHWLERAKPVTAEDRNMQLLGLHWVGVDTRDLKRLRAAISANQRPDGGWAQHDGLPSDAYATGQSLYALAVAGMPTDSATYQRGVKFLLRTQSPDGTWLVVSRSPRIQAYFDGGFPYQADQWISEWGTAWAAMALTRSMNEPSLRASK